MKSRPDLPPLRRVMAWFGKYEELECGHVYLAKDYAFGRTVAARRRCRACLKERIDTVNRADA